MSTEGGIAMKFLIRPAAPLDGRPLQARAVTAWRSAADLVWARWELLGEATPESRAGAFAAYHAALDAEAAAAGRLAEMRASRAA
jgi:hypothetical protein